MTRLLIVCDVYGWAWHRMADGIAAHSGDVDVTVVDTTQFGVFTQKAGWLLREFDGVSQCSWTESSTRPEMKVKTAWLASHGFDYPFPGEGLVGQIATRLRNRENAQKRLPQFDRVLCVSDRIHRSASGMCNATRVVPGVDESLFPESSLPNRERLVVGWCGQRDGVTKGYREVLEPLMRRLDGVVDWRANTRSAQDPLSQQEMVDWYHGIDLFVSTSCSEGFQMPVLEAASCGRPVIATDVGAANEVVTHGENGFIVPGYDDIGEADITADRITEQVLEYHRDRGLLNEHGAASRRTATERFRWADRAAEWVGAML